MGTKSTTPPPMRQAALVPFWGRLLAAVVFCISSGVFVAALGALDDASRETMGKLFLAGMSAGLAALAARRFPRVDHEAQQGPV